MGTEKSGRCREAAVSGGSPDCISLNIFLNSSRLAQEKKKSRKRVSTLDRGMLCYENIDIQSVRRRSLNFTINNRTTSISDLFVRNSEVFDKGALNFT